MPRSGSTTPRRAGIRPWLALLGLLALALPADASTCHAPDRPTLGLAIAGPSTDPRIIEIEGGAPVVAPRSCPGEQPGPPAGRSPLASPAMSPVVSPGMLPAGSGPAFEPPGPARRPTPPPSALDRPPRIAPPADHPR